MYLLTVEPCQIFNIWNYVHGPIYPQKEKRKSKERKNKKEKQVLN